MTVGIAESTMLRSLSAIATDTRRFVPSDRKCLVEYHELYLPVRELNRVRIVLQQVPLADVYLVLIRDVLVDRHHSLRSRYLLWRHGRYLVESPIKPAYFADTEDIRK